MTKSLLSPWRKEEKRKEREIPDKGNRTSDDPGEEQKEKTEVMEESTPFVPEKAFPIHRTDRLVQDLDEIAVAEEEKTEEADGNILEKGGKNPKSSPEEIRQGVEEVKTQIATKEAGRKKEYKFPPLSLLRKGKHTGGDSNAHLRGDCQKAPETLHNFA